MSCSNRGRLRTPWQAVLVIAALLGPGVAACTLSPVYAPTSGGRSVPLELAAIGIELPSGRVEQEVRNRLIFAFGNNAGVAERYKLRLTVSVTDNLVGVTRLAVSPSYSVDVAVAYELTEIATGTILTRGVARGTASYDRSNQGFANVRARIDAEDRGATVAADEIRLRIAAALSQR